MIILKLRILGVQGMPLQLWWSLVGHSPRSPARRTCLSLHNSDRCTIAAAYKEDVFVHICDVYIFSIISIQFSLIFSMLGRAIRFIFLARCSKGGLNWMEPFEHYGFRLWQKKNIFKWGWLIFFLFWVLMKGSESDSTADNLTSAKWQVTRDALSDVWRMLWIM